MALYFGFCWREYEARGGMDDCCYIGKDARAARTEIEEHLRPTWIPPTPERRTTYAELAAAANRGYMTSKWEAAPETEVVYPAKPGEWGLYAEGELLDVNKRRIMRVDDVAGDEHAPVFVWSDWEPFGITV